MCWGAAKHLNDIAGNSHGVERRIHLFAQDDSAPGVDGDNAVPLPLQFARDPVAGTSRIRREAYDRDHLGPAPSRFIDCDRRIGRHPADDALAVQDRRAGGSQAGRGVERVVELGDEILDTLDPYR